MITLKPVFFLFGKIFYASLNKKKPRETDNFYLIKHLMFNKKNETSWP